MIEHLFSAARGAVVFVVLFVGHHYTEVISGLGLTLYSFHYGHLVWNDFVVKRKDEPELPG